MAIGADDLDIVAYFVALAAAQAALDHDFAQVESPVHLIGTLVDRLAGGGGEALDHEGEEIQGAALALGIAASDLHHVAVRLDIDGHESLEIIAYELKET